MVPATVTRGHPAAPTTATQSTETLRTVACSLLPAQLPTFAEPLLRPRIAREPLACLRWGVRPKRAWHVTAWHVTVTHGCRHSLGLAAGGKQSHDRIGAGADYQMSWGKRESVPPTNRDTPSGFSRSSPAAQHMRCPASRLAAGRRRRARPPPLGTRRCRPARRLCNALPGQLNGAVIRHHPTTSPWQRLDKASCAVTY